ncbi:MobA/MobL family protein [Marinivivus vitaminiproducens]|uniref:MobA/MobL family protein n=1 Tax=Marinivivus vitaminiproducens TaxID=3035935 RepID=UPI00279DC83B|nr:MobA/MobL family protein [Geminicoccaceae bacterium SCSIO 64248]
MATFHAGITMIKRGKGQSVVQRASWRCGVALYDRRRGCRCSVSGQRGTLLWSQVLTPEGVDTHWRDREMLWNTVEERERRRDASLARELEFTLPRELSDAEKIDVTVGFITNECVAGGMIADTTIRATSARDGGRNVHAYALLTTRRVLRARLFGLKERDWNAPHLYWRWRQSIAKRVNDALEQGGHEARVDHRSYAERDDEVRSGGVKQPGVRFAQRRNMG